LKKVLSFVADLFDEKELFYPAIRLKEEGYEVEFAGPEAVEYSGKSGLKQKADLSFESIKVEDYEGLLIPGGYAPDKMRVHEAALEAVRQFQSAGKPIAMICHAGWVGASAGIVKGRRLTSTITIKDDLENAGATWVDEAPVVDENLVTGRNPGDLHSYTKAFIDLLAK
jgi:protease I